MKVIIAGSRSITSYEVVCAAVKHSMLGSQIAAVVSGGASGVDKLAEKWAEDNDRRLLVFRADWIKYGRGAGYVRNIEMAKYADALIAVWDGKSKGTKHMIDTMSRMGKRVHVHAEPVHVDTRAVNVLKYTRREAKPKKRGFRKIRLEEP